MHTYTQAGIINMTLAATAVQQIQSFFPHEVRIGASQMLDIISSGYPPTHTIKNFNITVRLPAGIDTSSLNRTVARSVGLPINEVTQLPSLSCTSRSCARVLLRCSSIDNVVPRSWLTLPVQNLSLIITLTAGTSDPAAFTLPVMSANQPMVVRVLPMSAPLDRYALYSVCVCVCVCVCVYIYVRTIPWFCACCLCQFG
jgi:hypothetical protein